MRFDAGHETLQFRPTQSGILIFISVHTIGDDDADRPTDRPQDCAREKRTRESESELIDCARSNTHACADYCVLHTHTTIRTHAARAWPCGWKPECTCTCTCTQKYTHTHTQHIQSSSRSGSGSCSWLLCCVLCSVALRRSVYGTQKRVNYHTKRS